MNGKKYFSMLARYHRWAYERLFERVNELSADDYYADKSLFFGSVHGSINHLLLVDRLWLDRLNGIRTGKVNLAEQLVAGRDELHRAVLDQCDAFIEFVDNVDESRLEADIAYVNSKGEDIVMQMAPLIAHMVNHGTHHRGQVSTALTQAGIEAPVMDLPYFLLDKR